MKVRGFTILEISIVLAIIGILLAVVLRATGLVGRGNVRDLITTGQDMAAAVREFKLRFKLYPGDLLILAASPEIPQLSATCMSGGANAGNNNGVIEAIESVCVPEVLFRSGIISKVRVTPAGIYEIPTAFGNAIVVASSLSGVTVPSGVSNVLVMSNLPCDIALEVDRTLDDGILGTGRVAASVGTCTPGGTNDPVPILGIGL